MKIILILILVVLVSYTDLSQESENPKPRYDIFAFDKVVTLPGTPEQIFDAATGDISGWWDHSFSDNPKKFFMEAKLMMKEMEFYTPQLFILNVER